jgi:hypothetical protein
VLRRCPAPLITMAAAMAVGLGSQTTSSRADVTAPTFTVYNVGSTSSTDISQWTVNSGVQIKYDGTVTAPSSAPNPWDGSTSTTWLQYTLTTTQAIASAGATPPASSSSSSSPQVLALDAPISILPSNVTSNLLYVTSDSTNYYTQNSNDITVQSGTTTLQQNGQPLEVQALGLNFYGQGLQAGQSITFDLPFNASVVGSPASATSTTSTSTSTSSSGGGSSSTSTSTSTSTSSSSGASPQGAETPEPLSLLVWTAMAGAGVWRVRARAGRG